MFTARKLLQYALFSLTFCLLLAKLSPHPVLAQANPQPSPSGITLGISRSVLVTDKNVQEGSVISTSDHGPILAVSPYDSQVMGVISNNAAVVLNEDQNPSNSAIVSDGLAQVLVSSKAGNIKSGDLVTTSTIPGVAIKAVQSGYVLGTALEDYNNSDPQKTGKIKVDLNLHYFNSKPVFPGSLTDIFKLALLSTKEGPSAIFKYILAGMVAIASLVLGFLSFARTAAKGVEALGRNPAASRIIHLGIILNIGITVIIVAAGFSIGFLILRL
jgi:hypothetical protein